MEENYNVHKYSISKLSILYSNDKYIDYKVGKKTKHNSIPIN